MYYSIIQTHYNDERRRIAKRLGRECGWVQEGCGRNFGAVATRSMTVRSVIRTGFRGHGSRAKKSGEGEIRKLCTAVFDSVKAVF